MSTEGVDRQQIKAKEFMSLLPLTLAVAGLPNTEPGKHYNEGQMELRGNTIRLAYKIARQVLQEIIK